MTISGERTEQLDIFCCVTGFASDFLSFIDEELIRFFHRALQLKSEVHGLILLVLRSSVLSKEILSPMVPTKPTYAVSHKP